MKKIVLLLIFSIFFFAGCKQESSIKIQKESNFSSMINEINKNNQVSTSVKKSSGIVILKDNQTEKSDFKMKNFGMDFGPKDIDFDLKIK